MTKDHSKKTPGEFLADKLRAKDPDNHLENAMHRLAQHPHVNPTIIRKLIKDISPPTWRGTNRADDKMIMRIMRALDFTPEEGEVFYGLLRAKYPNITFNPPLITGLISQDRFADDTPFPTMLESLFPDDDSIMRAFGEGYLSRIGMAKDCGFPPDSGMIQRIVDLCALNIADAVRLAVANHRLREEGKGSSMHRH